MAHTYIKMLPRRPRETGGKGTAEALEPWVPAFEPVMKSHTLSFRGGGAAREPGTQEHGPIKAWEKLVFLGSGPGPSRHPGMPFIGITSKGFFLFS
jgi:hypothetical protein